MQTLTGVLSKTRDARIAGMRWLRLATLFAVMHVLLLGYACDPVGPGATGRVIMQQDADIGSGQILEMRAWPDDGGPFDSAMVDWADREWLLVRSWALSDIEFPFTYQIGGEIGYTDNRRFRFVTWIAESEGLHQPAEAAWYGTRLFDIGECGFPFSGFCGVTGGTDVEIGRR